MVERKTSPACLHCGGDCCKKLAVQVHVGGNMKEMLFAHYGRDVEVLRFKLRHTCPHLTDDGLCELWHEDPEQDNRPVLCKTYMCEKADNPGLMIIPVEQVLDFEL